MDGGVGDKEDDVQEAPPCGICTGGGWTVVPNTEMGATGDDWVWPEQGGVEDPESQYLPVVLCHGSLHCSGMIFNSDMLSPPSCSPNSNMAAWTL